MKEVIILGRGPTLKDCPYDVETWAVNDGYLDSRRIDKLFLTDAWSEFNLADLKEAQHKFGCEIVVAALPPAWSPNGLALTLYPIEEVMRRFQTRFFSNTVCYMVAYALLKGYQRLRFYGVDMLTHSAYIHEKGGVEFWMGVALGMGVDCENTKGSATGKPQGGRLYGDWGDRTPLVTSLAQGFHK